MLITGKRECHDRKKKNLVFHTFIQLSGYNPGHSCFQYKIANFLLSLLLEVEFTIWSQVTAEVRLLISQKTGRSGSRQSLP